MKILMNRVFLLSLTTALCITLCSLPTAAQQTNPDPVRASCPSASAVADAADRASRDNDPTHFDLYRRASGLYHDCMNTLPAGKLHDYAREEYIDTLFFSVRGPTDPNFSEAEGRRALETVVKESDDLIAQTNIADIRRHALMVRDYAQNELSLFKGP